MDGTLGLFHKIVAGAYVADSLVAGDDASATLWQLWRQDLGIDIARTPAGLSIRGTSSREGRGFSGYTSRQLYPADAVLVCDVITRHPVDQDGTYGAVIHLCSRLVGDEVKTLEIPDNNVEAIFGRFEGRPGWYRWYYDQTGGDFYKWVTGTEPDRPPAGDEDRRFVTVRISHSAAAGSTDASVGPAGNESPLGSTVYLSKLFSSVELKVDVQNPGIEIDVVFRNCRLYPNPASAPVRIFIGTADRAPKPIAGATITATETSTGEVIARGMAEPDGVARLDLPRNRSYPVSVRLDAEYRSETLGAQEVPAGGVSGLYPGDVYAWGARIRR